MQRFNKIYCPSCENKNLVILGVIKMNEWVG